MINISRSKYASLYGPTTGDRFRFADTSLIARIERDFASYGEESKFGGGKTARDGMSQSPTALGAADLILTNAIVIDHGGIFKADIAIKNGKISAIGKSGNPNITDGVTAGLEIGAETEILSCEGRIVTAGAIDSHIHFISPEQIEVALASGVTTMIGGGTGPNTGTNATTCSPGAWNIARMMEAVENYPLNFGFMGKGNSSSFAALATQIRAGAMGLKLHEDWGSTPAAIDVCLRAADEFGVQVAIHTDTLNEAGFVGDTIAAFRNRTIHAFHTEGAGGGHAPDILRVAGLERVLPSSTNPTLPYAINTLDEHLDMLMVCHHLSAKIPEDLSFAESRIRGKTIAAEDALHDIGAISMTSSDSQAMGRVGETIIRTWQVADSMKRQRGALAGDSDRDDNERIKRFVAKYTINPAIACGIDEFVGSVEVGKMADLVVWSRAFFGAKPDLVLKGGMIACAQMGDANASIPTPEPNFSREMFGAKGRAGGSTSAIFVSQAALEGGALPALNKRFLPIASTRNLTKRDMKRNDWIGEIRVDPETYDVFIDGEKIESSAVKTVALGRRYFM